MKLTELKALEMETILALRLMINTDKNPQAAAVLLKHLRETSTNIGKWKHKKDAIEASKLPPS